MLKVVESKPDKVMKSSDSWRGSTEVIQVDLKDQSDSSMCSVDSVPEPVRPIDLSSKPFPLTLGMYHLIFDLQFNFHPI